MEARPLFHSLHFTGKKAEACRSQLLAHNHRLVDSQARLQVKAFLPKNLKYQMRGVNVTIFKVPPIV